MRIFLKSSEFPVTPIFHVDNNRDRNAQKLRKQKKKKITKHRVVLLKCTTG